VTSNHGPSIIFSTPFAPTQIIPLRHDLHRHPLLQLPKLVELGHRLAQRGSVRSHNDQASEGTSFNHAPELHPPGQSVEESLRQLESAHCWMSLQNVQQDPEYRRLVDEVLDYVKPVVDAQDPGMCFRGGWIFVTSPGAVTPFHMDTENSLFFHIRGEKRFNAWDPSDREILPEEALELFHGESKRDRLVWSDAFLSRAHRFDFQPGEGAFLPVTAPHMVRNGDTVSISMSCTYYSDRTRRLRRIYRANHKLRTLGLTPRPVGQMPLVDAAKSAAVWLVQNGRRVLTTAQGKPVWWDRCPYAPDGSYLRRSLKNTAASVR
jgi:hypothetical protein